MKHASSCFAALYSVFLCAWAPQATAQDGAASSTLELPSTGKPAAQESLQFIGNATVLIRYGELTILTDPNFLHKGDHVHLGYGLKARRLTDPAIAFEKLPHVDLVLLSHLHGDHFDQLVQEKMRRDMPIVSTREATQGLREFGFGQLHGLRHWESVAVRKGATRLRITSMPARHGPAGGAVALPETMGAMLEFGGAGSESSYRMYISGDTLVYDDIKDIPKRYPDIDLALLHLGGTRILGLVKVTMDGKDGVKMLQLVAPHHAIPIHYNDYDVFKSPLSEFQKEVKAAGLEGKVTYLKHGDSYALRNRKR